MGCCRMHRVQIYLILLLGILSGAIVRAAQSPDEYQVKAAFVLNFMKFTDWPDKKLQEGDPIVIGIIGKNIFGKSLGLLKTKQVSEHSIRIEQLPSWKDISDDNEQLHLIREKICACHLLFISPSEKDEMALILNTVRGKPVLTVSDVPGFVNKDTDSGMIGFAWDENKIRFDINLKSVKNAQLDIRSKLLRLARHVEQ